MALEPVIGVARVVCNGALAGIPTATIFHVRHEPVSAWSQPTIEDLVTTLRTSFVSRFLPLVEQEFVLGNVDATDLSSDLGVVASSAGSSPGALSGTRMPANAAQVITWKIARHYRGGHPRTYLPPPDGSKMLNANSWAPAHITAMQGAAVGFLNDINGADYAGVAGRLVCVHRFRGFTYEPNPPHRKIPTPLIPPLVDNITDGTVDTRVDSQRRRLGPDR